MKKSLLTALIALALAACGGGNQTDKAATEPKADTQTASATSSDLPQTDAHRPEYMEIYRNLANSLALSQQAEGFWTRSLLDPQHAPGYETSGTAFFSYGFLWGVNNGVLDKKKYSATIEKSWNYLTEIALQNDGSVGYVQPIGERADQHKNVGPQTTADFGVGAFLLAATERYKYLNRK